MYGLQLRDKKPSQQRKPKLPSIFADDDDGDDAEREISRHAEKNKSLKEVEEMQKKALEEDPDVFDYDGVYDKMKQKAARPASNAMLERKSRYIPGLMKKAKEREREHEVVYERKLKKERDMDADLYKDKDKFVTGAYKRKLAEQEKWVEEERLRELREARDDVTNKKDLTDFYFGLHKNVAFGGGEADASKSENQHGRSVSRSPIEQSHKQHERSISRSPSERSDVADKMVKQHGRSVSRSPSEPDVADKAVKQHERSVSPSASELSHVSPTEQADLAPVSGEESKPTETEQPKKDHHKKSQDAVADARQRYLERKKAKVSVDA